MFNKDEISRFPITEHLSQISETLFKSQNHVLILTSQTGSGKSTVLPLEFLDKFKGKILMTEPRRIATVGISNRISALNKTECGKEIGYKIFMENKVSDSTKMEVVSEAILVKMLQEDQTLEDYDLVILDEFHERSIYLDLSLAFLKEALMLRDNLYVIIMSATMDTKKLSAYFENQCSVLSIPGSSFPVEVFYENSLSIEKAIYKYSDSRTTLVFLPGLKEILKCKQDLEAFLLNEKILQNYEISILHSSVSLEDQKKILNPSKTEKIKIILSTNIAETSLTIPGVSCVIDSGLCKVNRLDISTGMDNLVTEQISNFSADQRKGRAGRLSNGRCVRLWSKNEVLQNELTPQIKRSDLTELVLECAERGIYNLTSISFLDPPNSNEWNVCSALLQTLNCLDSDFHITEKGKIVLSLGLHPRLSCICIDDFLNNNCKNLSDFVINFLIKMLNLDHFSKNYIQNFVKNIEFRLKKFKFGQFFENSCHILLSGYPDRLAKNITENDKKTPVFQFPSGRKATLLKTDPFYFNPPQWIVAPDVHAGTSQGIIYSYYEVNDESLKSWLDSRKKIENVSIFDQNKLFSFENQCYGKIILSSKKVSSSKESYALAWKNELLNKGFSALPSSKEIDSLLIRTKFYLQQTKTNSTLCKLGSLPEQTSSDNLEEILIQNVEKWLFPFITDSNLSSQSVYDSLNWFLDGAIINQKVPKFLILPNGKRCKVTYETQTVIRPVINVIIQRFFGCFTTPEICGMKVLLKLLSPANRPLQITDDLENFWNSTWPEICKEMKGRYPKHNWDYKVSDDSE